MLTISTKASSKTQSLKIVHKKVMGKAMHIWFTYVHRLKSQTEKIFLTFFIFLRHMGQVPASSEILHRESIRI